MKHNPTYNRKFARRILGTSRRMPFHHYMRYRIAQLIKQRIVEQLTTNDK